MFDEGQYFCIELLLCHNAVWFIRVRHCTHKPKLVDASAHLISVLSFVQIQNRVLVRTNLPILMLFVTVLPMRRSSL
jgi:hypothetical protein